MLNPHTSLILINDQQYISSQLPQLDSNFIFSPPNFNTFPIKTLTESDASTPTSLMDNMRNPDALIDLSLQRSTVADAATFWRWGDDANDCMKMMKRTSGDQNQNHLGVSAMKMKKINYNNNNNKAGTTMGRRKVREPRFCFKTMSDVDVLDDGYKWRKYGQKVVKNTQHPRSYYRCTQENCGVKKRVERLAEDPRMVITTYEGRHVHSPSHDNDDDDHHQFQPSSRLDSLFW